MQDSRTNQQDCYRSFVVYGGCVIKSKDVSILDMNTRYCCLLECFEKWSKDASEVVSGEAVLFRDFPPMPDMILTH